MDLGKLEVNSLVLATPGCCDFPVLATREVATPGYLKHRTVELRLFSKLNKILSVVSIGGNFVAVFSKLVLATAFKVTNIQETVYVNCNYI